MPNSQPLYGGPKRPRLAPRDITGEEAPMGVAGNMANVLSGSGGEAPAPQAQGYDPGAFTVAEVQDYVTANPGERDAVLAAEQAGKNRVTLVTWLTDFTG